MWFNVKTLVGLPGMPCHRSSSARKLAALAEPHQVRCRAGRGGGYEYHVSCLPPETQAALGDLGNESESAPADEEQGETDMTEMAPIYIEEISFTSNSVDAQKPPEVSDKSSERLTESAQDFFPAWAHDPAIWTTDITGQRVTARSLILDALSQMRQLRGLKLEQARHLFASEYNGGTLRIPQRVRELVPSISRGALAEWAGKQKRGDLKPNWRGLQNALTQEQQEMILGILAAKPWLGATGICREIAVHSDYVPHKGQVWRFITGWKAANPQEWALIENSDNARSRYAPAFGRQDHTENPNDLWEIDCTRVDLKIQDGESAKRWTLVALIDIHTRRAQVLVTPQPQGRATMQAMRRAILAWGLPRKVKLDNGKEFKNNFVLQRLQLLGITPWFCNPGQPQEKPHVERFFGTLQHGALESLPGFVGHSVAQRKNIQKSTGEPGWEITMPPDALQTWLDLWLEQYHQRHHSGLGCSPLEKLTQSFPRGWVQRSVNPKQLDFVLLPGTTNPDALQRIGKNGLTVAGCHFVEPSLGSRVGERVHVRYDPEDLSQVWVYDNALLENLLCVARNADGLRKEERVALAKKAKGEYAEVKSRVVEFRREGRKLDKKIRENPGLLVQGHAAPTALVRRQVQELSADLRSISAPPPPIDPMPRWEDVELDPVPPPPPEELAIVLNRVCDAWLEGETPAPGDCDRVARYALTNPGQLLIKCVLPNWDLRDAITEFFKNYKQTA